MNYLSFDGSHAYVISKFINDQKFWHFFPTKIKFWPFDPCYDLIMISKCSNKTELVIYALLPFIWGVTCPLLIDFENLTSWPLFVSLWRHSSKWPMTRNGHPPKMCCPWTHKQESIMKFRGGNIFYGIVVSNRSITAVFNKYNVRYTSEKGSSHV